MLTFAAQRKGKGKGRTSHRWRWTSAARGWAQHLPSSKLQL